MVLAGCSALANSSQSEPATVSVRLKWLHQVQFAGIYTAEKEGYYAEENLTVKLDEVDFNTKLSYESVLAGQNDIGVAAPEELIKARSEGKPLKAIAVVFRLNPFLYIASNESGVKTPQDFVGKTVAVSPGQGTILYTAMMSNLGIDRSQINEIPPPSFNLKECWDVAAVCPDYATYGLATVRYEGLDFTPIWPNDYGVSYYGDVIFTTDQFLEEHPDVVERFVRATLKGWQKAVDDPELATKHTLTYKAELDEGLQFTALESSLPLIDTGEDRVGWMRPEVWQQMYDVLLDQDLIAQPIDITTVYTNEFVEKMYAE
jgi:NitT/TauT family transport system substrate-binding protein